MAVVIGESAIRLGIPATEPFAVVTAAKAEAGRFAPALLLLALIIGPLLSSATSQVSVSVHMPFGNVSGAGSSSNNLLVTRAQFAASWNASKRTANWVAFGPNA
jgi:DNA/RNA endonuclease G (NUC1)